MKNRSPRNRSIASALQEPVATLSSCNCYTNVAEEVVGSLDERLIFFFNTKTIIVWYFYALIKKMNMNFFGILNIGMFHEVRLGLISLN